MGNLSKINISATMAVFRHFFSLSSKMKSFWILLTMLKYNWVSLYRQYTDDSTLSWSRWCLLYIPSCCHNLRFLLCHGLFTVSFVVFLTVVGVNRWSLYSFTVTLYLCRIWLTSVSCFSIVKFHWVRMLYWELWSVCLVHLPITCFCVISMVLGLPQPETV